MRLLKKRLSFCIAMAIVLLLSLISLMPFYMMLVMGTYKTADLYTGAKLWFGDYLSQNLETLSRIPMMRYYTNSLKISVSCTVINIAITSMLGFAVAKYRFHLKKAIHRFIMLTLMIPSQLTLVGFYLEMSALGWTNTHLPLIIPPAATSFSAFWMIQYTTSAIPGEVLESARIDGCSEWQVFTRIALPFMRPACVTLALMTFLSSWNNLLMPTIILSDNKLYPITLGIKELASVYFTDVGAQVLGLSLAALPILVLFIIFSKNLIDGLAVGAVKG